jgi:hypothetical protein
VALCVLSLAVVSGCGADDQVPSAELPDALGYLPRDASAVAIVPTDLEGDQLSRLYRLLEPVLREVGVDGPRSEVIASVLSTRTSTASGRPSCCASSGRGASPSTGSASGRSAATCTRSPASTRATTPSTAPARSSSG